MGTAQPSPRARKRAHRSPAPSPSAEASPPREAVPSLDEVVFAELRARLGQRGSVLATDPNITSQLARQVKIVLDAVLRDLSGARDDLPPTSGAVTVGRRRAAQGVHPSQSLLAADILFDVALPHLVVRFDTIGSAAAVARSLHAAIMASVTPAAVGYVDVLLELVSSSQREERRRLARDMHDQVAHGIGVGVQGIELAMLDADALPAAVRERLASTLLVLQDTVETVRALAAHLRDAAHGRGLAEAVEGYVQLTVPSAVTAELKTFGDLSRLPGYVVEEAYLVVREAFRNALLHAAELTRIDIELTVSADLLTAVVRDDGAGVEVLREKIGTMGLASMRERAAVLNGTLEVRSCADGVEVALSVPLPVPR